MYAVIFTAEINQLDNDYSATASRMRELAKTKYGCKEFISATEGNMEIAVSHWTTLEQIQAWKEDVEHLAAQQRGRAEWYRSYRVEVCEIVREYRKTA